MKNETEVFVDYLESTLDKICNAKHFKEAIVIHSNKINQTLYYSNDFMYSEKYLTKVRSCIIETNNLLEILNPALNVDKEALQQIGSLLENIAVQIRNKLDT